MKKEYARIKHNWDSTGGIARDDIFMLLNIVERMTEEHRLIVIDRDNARQGRRNVVTDLEKEVESLRNAVSILVVTETRATKNKREIEMRRKTIERQIMRLENIIRGWR